MDIIKGTKRTRTDHIIKETKRTRTDIIKGTKRTLILSSKKQTNYKLIIIKGKKTRVSSKEPTNHKLSKELSEIIKNYDVCQLDDVPINDTNKAMMLRIGIFVLYISKVTKRTLILSSKKQMNHKLIIIKGKKPGYYQRNQRTINYQRNQRNQRIIY